MMGKRMKTSDGFGDELDLVPLPTEIATLPLRLRIAWACSVMEHLIPLFSSYAISKFRLSEAVEFAWRFALSGKASTRTRRSLISGIEELEDDAEDERYGIEILLAGSMLLSEIEDDAGCSAS